MDKGEKEPNAKSSRKTRKTRNKGKAGKRKDNDDPFISSSSSDEYGSNDEEPAAPVLTKAERQKAEAAAKEATAEKEKNKAKTKTEAAAAEETRLLQVVIMTSLPLSVGESQQDLQKRVENLYDMLIILETKQHKNRKVEKYMPMPAVARKILTFFFMKTFNIPGVCLVHRLVNNAKKTNEWKVLSRARLASKDEKIPKAFRDLYANFLIVPSTRSRINTVIGMESEVKMYQQYRACCKLMKMNPPAKEIVNYMEAKGFTTWQGLGWASVLNKVVAAELGIEDDGVFSYFSSGCVLYRIVNRFGIGILPLLPAGMTKLWTEIVPKKASKDVLELVDLSFPELRRICGMIEELVWIAIKAGENPQVKITFSGADISELIMVKEIKMDEMEGVIHNAVV